MKFVEVTTSTSGNAGGEAGGKREADGERDVRTRLQGKCPRLVTIVLLGLDLG